VFLRLQKDLNGATVSKNFFNEKRASILEKVPLNLSYFRSLMFWKYNDNRYMKRVEERLAKELDIVEMIKSLRTLKILKYIVFKKH